MESLLPIVIVLVLASGFGFWHNRSRGKVVVKSDKGLITSAMIGADLGSRATLLLIEDVTADMADVAHVEVDAEANLELVRKLDIRSTPTTLFLDSRGHEVGRAMGAPKRDQVLKAISAIA